MNAVKLQNLYFGLYEKLKRHMIAKNVKKIAQKWTDPNFKFTPEQEKEIRDFYAPYEKIDLIFHKWNVSCSGVYSPLYLPMDMYLNRVDEYFNNRAESKFLDNKCYYNNIFAGIPQPATLVCRIGGLWFSGDRQQISFEQVKTILDREKDAFAKIAAGSCGGKGVSYLSAADGKISEQLTKFVKGVPNDVIVQRPVKQHSALAKIHESSVNTYRIISLLSENGVKIYSAVLRVGIGGQKVDNASKGGVACGITDDGVLKKYVFQLQGQRYETHPTNGFVFEGYQVPSIDKAKELVKKAHVMVPHFKLVSWDVIICEDGEPLLLEANLAKGTSELHQFCNGPLFGEDTKKILDEVFGK